MLSGAAAGALAMVLAFLRAAILVAASAIDVRERRFPNGLAVTLAIVCAVSTLAGAGVRVLALRALAALALIVALGGFEVVWRRVNGNSGIGMGDAKFVAALALFDPMRAVLSFAAGLAVLAGFGIIARRGTLPALPFISAAWFALALIALIGTPWG